MNDINNGIIMNGGFIKADNLAGGQNATIIIDSQINNKYYRFY